MQEVNETYMKQLGKMSRPIPGQSLTADPANPAPYEKAPEFTKKKDALEEIFSNMTREEIYVPMIQALIEGTTVMETAQVILFEGFRQGKWNPDLFVMLIEPTAYMIMALAERADVDYMVDREGDEPDPDSEIERKFDQIGGGLKKGNIPEDALTEEQEEVIEGIDPLIKKREPTAEAPVEESLISRRA